MKKENKKVVVTAPTNEVGKTPEQLAYELGQLAFNNWQKNDKTDFPINVYVNDSMDCANQWRNGFAKSYNDYLIAGNERIYVCFDCGSRDFITYSGYGCVIRQVESRQRCNKCGCGNELCDPMEEVSEYLFH